MADAPKNESPRATYGTMRLLRPAACAEALGVSTTTLWRLTKSDNGFPVAFRLGRNSVAFSEPEVMEWLAARRVSRRPPSNP